MPFYRVGGHMVHLKLGGKLAKNPPAPCCARIPLSAVPGAIIDDLKARSRAAAAKPEPEVRCMGISTHLCDWPVDGGTCDAPLCEEHAHQVGPDRHYCPRHRAEQQRAAPELF